MLQFPRAPTGDNLFRSLEVKIVRQEAAQLARHPVHAQRTVVELDGETVVEAVGFEITSKDHRSRAVGWVLRVGPSRAARSLGPLRASNAGRAAGSFFHSNACMRVSG